ncbi:MAG: O-antigen ligase family protein [Candidatus Uhrbacteria bacterium]
MINLQEVYKKAEQEARGYIFLLILGLVLALGSIVFISPLATLAVLLGLLFFIFSFSKPHWVLGFVAIYLPFEPFILKWVPDDIYVFARYFSELLIYCLVAVVIWQIITRVTKIKQSPIDFPLVAFLIILATSIIVNFIPPTIAILGSRQILRFILVFFAAYYLVPSKDYLKKLTAVMFVIVLLQSALGLFQAGVGGAIDTFLLPSETRTYSDIQLKSGVEQFWDPGSRVFATMGRYDQLGTFIAFFLLLAAGLIYERQSKKQGHDLIWLFVIGLPALLLTYSRSSWFGFLLGFLFIGLLIKRDRRVLVATILSAILISSYLAYSGMVVRYLTDLPGQSVAERFFEAFSYERWRGEYYGLGRLYWIVQTPLEIVPASPFFGHGPGQYGGGAVTALGNTAVYEELGLPFGVYGTDGYVDNNWLSLWGETGTLGLFFYLLMFVALFRYSYKLYRSSDDPYVRGLALGYCAALLAVSLNAFLATFLEVRTLAFYMWMYGGFIVLLGERTERS